MISIIIPFRDKVNLLIACISSILEKSTHSNYEIILVNNNSVKKETVDYLSRLSKNPSVILLRYSQTFNFSALNNFSAKKARGEYLLFLNNDTEVISEDWLEEMVKLFKDPEVGAIGAKLLYPNGTIQHAGIKIGKNIATHQFLGMKDQDLGENNIIRQVDAVTGACMMTKKDLFWELGGFNEENLPIAYNDVDYCLRLREKRLKTIWTPYAKLTHYESISRGSDVSLFTKIFRRKRYNQFKKERNYMKKKWKIASLPKKIILADKY